MMEYILTGIACVAVLFLVIFLLYNRRQEAKIKRSISEIQKMKTGKEDPFTFFE